MNPKMFDTGFYKSDRIMPKSKFRMCITTMREIPEETGEKHFQLVKSEWVDARRKEFQDDLMKEFQAGHERNIEIVFEKPDKFVFNQLYMLATRDVMWVWVLEPTE